MVAVIALNAAVPPGGTASTGCLLRTTSRPWASRPTTVATTFSAKCHRFGLASTSVQITRWSLPADMIAKVRSFAASGRSTSVVRSGSAVHPARSEPAASAATASGRATRFTLRCLTLP
nr:MAG: hypothetical protein DIU60_11980 [Actinomycetota bacterium]